MHLQFSIIFLWLHFCGPYGSRFSEAYPLAQAEHEQSIRLYLGALRHIKDESLEARKKELRKVLNARKKELSAAAQIQGENP